MVVYLEACRSVMTCLLEPRTHRRQPLRVVSGRIAPAEADSVSDYLGVIVLFLTMTIHCMSWAEHDVRVDSRVSIRSCMADLVRRWSDRHLQQPIVSS